MTVMEIRNRVRARGKSLSRQGLYFHLKALKVKSLGVARPANYPEDTAKKIIIRLGLVMKPSHSKRKGTR